MITTKTTQFFSVLVIASLCVAIEASAQDHTEMQMMATHAGEQLADEMVITITDDEVRVNLDRAITVENGDIPVSARVSSTSPIVFELQNIIESALHDAESWSIRRGERIVRQAAIAADRDTTYQVLTYVMMTASAAGIQSFSFVTVEASWDELWGEGLNTGASHRPPLHRLMVHSPQMPHRHDQDNEEVSPPRVLVAITEEGFTISDLRQSEGYVSSGLGMPVDGCAMPAESGNVPVTVCVGPGEGRLVDRLDYRRLYNRLAQIKAYPEWSNYWDEDNTIIYLVADRETPLDVVLRVMDVSQTARTQTEYADDEAFQTESGGSDHAPLFPRPVLLLPRAAR